MINRNQPNATLETFSRRYVGPALIAACAFAAALPASAQAQSDDDLAINADAGGEESADPLADPSTLLPPTSLTDVNLAEATLHWGRVALRPGASYSVSYNDNIFGGRPTAPGTELEDVIHRVALDFQASVLEAGEARFAAPAIAYSPEFVFLQNNSDRNTVNHSGRLQLTAELPRTSFALNHISSDREEIYAEAALRERQQLHLTTLSVLYDLSDKMDIESRTTQNLTERSATLSTREWREDLWFDYYWRAKLRAGFGVAGGYTEVDNGLSSWLNSEQVRLRYDPTEKLLFELRGGAEWRFFSGSDGETVFGPVAGFTATYQMRFSTRISLTADHQSRPSNLAPDQLTTSSRVGVVLDHQFPQRFFGTLSASYASNEYDQARSTAAELSSYDDYSVQALFGYKATRRLQASVFFRHLGRGAGSGLDSFESNEIGFTTSYHY